MLFFFYLFFFFLNFFFQAEDGIRDRDVTEFRRVLFRSNEVLVLKQKLKRRRRRGPEARSWLISGRWLGPDSRWSAVRLHRTEPAAVVVGEGRGGGGDVAVSRLRDEPVGVVDDGPNQVAVAAPNAFHRAAGRVRGGDHACVGGRESIRIVTFVERQNRCAQQLRDRCARRLTYRAVCGIEVRLAQVPAWCVTIRKREGGRARSCYTTRNSRHSPRPS